MHSVQGHSVRGRCSCKPRYVPSATVLNLDIYRIKIDIPKDFQANNEGEIEGVAAQVSFMSSPFITL
jgi:hypothetical protein